MRSFSVRFSLSREHEDSRRAHFAPGGKFSGRRIWPSALGEVLHHGNHQNGGTEGQRSSAAVCFSAQRKWWSAPGGSRGSNLTGPASSNSSSRHEVHSRCAMTWVRFLSSLFSLWLFTERAVVPRRRHSHALAVSSAPAVLRVDITPAATRMARSSAKGRIHACARAFFLVQRFDAAGVSRLVWRATGYILTKYSNLVAIASLGLATLAGLYLGVQWVFKFMVKLMHSDETQLNEADYRVERIALHGKPCRFARTAPAKVVFLLGGRAPQRRAHAPTTGKPIEKGAEGR